LSIGNQLKRTNEKLRGRVGGVTMPHKSLEVVVEPKVLLWARESIGLGIQEIAKKLKISENTIEKWETGQKKPKLTQIEKLAKIYKRPLAVFFLPKPPEDPPLPKDFRSLAMERRAAFSPKARLAIRRARRLQSLAIELAKSLNREITPQISRVSLLDDPEIVANMVRKQLGVELQMQFRWEDENKALNGWKRAIEKSGVLIFQISMPIEEARGFSLDQSKPPVIVLNLSDSPNGRVFSIFHEYAHLLLNDSGICNMEDVDDLSDEGKLTEKFCNHFAGAVLVPKDALLTHEIIKSENYPFEFPNETLKELSKIFKVSQEVILRRLLIFGLATVDFYRRKRKEWEAKSKEGQRKQKWGRQNPPKKCVQENGVPFVSLVLETHREEKITYRDVADYLTVPLKHLPKVEQLAQNNP
jgi:Zn-dependent peptidase ImmA (M78 family)/transcriptional regulator with XRE-family HTH domain